MKNKITEEQVVQICKDYQNGESMAILAKRYSICPAGVLYHLRKRGIGTRAPSSYRKHSVDKHFFDVIDTEAKAYWLGFISTDGHVRDKGVSIELAVLDKDHLEKFKRDIQSEHIIASREREGKSSTVRIYVSSTNLSKALRRLGLAKNKTFIIKPCKNVPDHLLRHYWRGAVDGDGSLFKNSSGYGKCINLVSASKEFLEGFREFILDHIPGFEGTILKRKGRTFYTINCNGVIKTRQLAYILYYGATIYLDRKMELAREIMEMRENFIDLSSLDKETLETLYRQNNSSWASVANILGIMPQSLYNLRKKRGMKVERKDKPFNYLNREEKIELIERTTKMTKNQSEAAKMLGITPASLFHMRKQLGLVKQLPNWINLPVAEKKEIIQEALDSSKDKREAAGKLGVSIDLLYKQRKQLGMIIPRSKEQ